MTDVQVVEDDVLALPDWDTALDQVTLTVTGQSANGVVTVFGWFAGRWHNISFWSMTDVSSASLVTVPNDLDTVVSVVAYSSTGTTAVRVGVDSDRSPIAVDLDSDLLIPVSEPLFDPITRTLSWTALVAEQDIDLIRSGVRVGSAQLFLSLPGTTPSPFVLPDLPASIATGLPTTNDAPYRAGSRC